MITKTMIGPGFVFGPVISTVVGSARRKPAPVVETTPRKQNLCFSIIGSITIDLLTLVHHNCIEYSNAGYDIDLFIDSGGGIHTAICDILLTLQTYKKLNPNSKTRAYVYKNAHSAACMLVLAADEVYCTDYTLFGPVNTQCNFNDNTFFVNNNIYEELVKLPKDALSIYRLDSYKRSDLYAIKLVKEILQNNPLYAPNTESLFNALYFPKYTHNESFTLKEMEEFGFTRTGPLSPEIRELFKTKTKHECFFR